MDHWDYKVGWICALEEKELPVAEAMLDKEHPPLPRDALDPNIYSLGQIGDHNVVVACCPAGRYGTDTAATVAQNMQRTFPAIHIRLMVGIGGGFPNPEKDIRLGDVVVSQPMGEHGGVLRYDMGKRIDGGFQTKGYLAAPPSLMLNAIGALKSRYRRKGSDLVKYMAEMLREYPLMEDSFGRPSDKYDIMSRDIGQRCCKAPANDADLELSGPVPSFKLQPRTYKNGGIDTSPAVHYGLIASGNQVIASFNEAENIEKLIAQDQKVLCFEMEAAGLVNDFPCLIIRGISDYADALKNDHWQEYAAATAAAYAKELLKIIPVDDVTRSATHKPRRDNVVDIGDGLERHEPVKSRAPRALGGHQISNKIGDISATGSNINANNTYF